MRIIFLCAVLLATLAQADHDVFLGDDGVPYVDLGGGLQPICGHYFWDSNYGAQGFCNLLGFESATLTATRALYSENAVVIGVCSKAQDFPDNCSKQPSAGECAKGLNVGIEIECSAPIVVDCVGAWGSCNGDCLKTYTITTEAIGSGANCIATNEQTDACARGEGSCPDFTCKAFDCGPDAHRHDMVDGTDFTTCCTCTFGQKSVNHIVPRGSFNVGSNSFRLEFDVPGQHSLHSISWVGADDASLGYSTGTSSMWQHVVQNACRSTWNLDQELGTFFGPGTTFVLKNGDVLSSLMEVESSVPATIKGQSYQQTHREDVEVQIGLSGTKTVSATFNMQTKDIEEFAYVVEGDVLKEIGSDDKISLILHVVTTNCVKEEIAVILGNEHVASSTSSFTPSEIAGGVCKQDATFTFVPVDYFSGTISLEFTSGITNETFAVDASVEYGESSVLDYLSFDAGMGFYATDSYVDTKSDFRLEETVYAEITATPLVAVPLSDMNVDSLILTQVDEAGVEFITDILSGDPAVYQYSSAFQVGSNDLHLQFDLDSLHFEVTPLGHPAVCTAEIEISYQDGTSVRRQLRRVLKEKEHVKGEFSIVPQESALAMFAETVDAYTSQHNVLACGFAFSLGVGLAYMYVKDTKKENEFNAYSSLL